MFIADFHIHSKYSRATSKECVPEGLELWARRKGLDLIGTGDFTHPAWRGELAEKLVPAEEGLYTLKDAYRIPEDLAGGDRRPRFIVSGEISSIYKKNGKVRKVHNLILLPGIEQAEALSRRLELIGNLHSDGRPILGLDSKDLLEITLDVCPDAIFIPAHIWTPHFSLFGAYSGFDSIEECFGDLTGHIHALETGLSSDPPMNWRLSALDRFTLISNSDAHSPGNLAREANVFSAPLSYPDISRALQERNADGFSGTIEFFPEEGKYHYDGHRNCRVCLMPSDTEAASGICPVCGGKITVGVLHRVEALADRGEGFVPPSAKPFESLVPLHEVIAASTGVGTSSVRVKEKYGKLLHSLGPELFILREASLDDIKRKAGPLIAEGICRLRRGQVEIEPGYDGKYGKIKILDENEIGLLAGQLCLFPENKKKEPAKSQNSPEQKEPATASPVSTDACAQDAGADKAKTTAGDLAYGLNPEQQEAVCASERAVAVSAGPGTGKTRTLVSRIIYLVEKRGVRPSQITAVTFTNKAAGEMRGRLEKHFGRAVKTMTIGTFHSICLRLLSARDGAEHTAVIDEPDALSLIEEILKGLGLKNAPRDVLREISLMKNGALPAGKASGVPEGVYDLYCRQLEQYGVLDYDDILLKVLGRFESASADGVDEKRLRNAFSHLLVDEFQDINDLQYRLIREWSRNSQSVFVIGDPDQSIYGFRGSDSRYFDQFQEDFSPVRKIRLSDNYRSTPEIVRCAGAVISKQAAGMHAHSLEAKRESGAKVRLLNAADAFSEAITVAKEINRLVGGVDMLDASSRRKGSAAGRQWGFSDIAVLYRTNRQSALLEQCLLKEGIAYTVAGRDVFLSDREVRKTIAFFRFLLNPGDLLSLKTCLKAFGGVRAELLPRLLGTYAAAPGSMSSLAEAFQSPGLPEAGLKSLLELFCRYEPHVRREKPSKLIEAFMSDNAMSGNRSMELLLHTAVMYGRLDSLLQSLALGNEQDVVRSGGKSYSPNAVSLMTLHAAKGLEFPVVFLCGLNEGTLPYKNRLGSSDPEEERRLFYVGITRARDELVLLKSGTPSPFLTDIPEASVMREEAFARRQVPEQLQQLSLFDPS